MAQSLNVPVAKVAARVQQLHEANPMLGHRGCRLSVTYPEILEMQVTAITEATINCLNKNVDAQPEIMIPLIGTAAELVMLRNRTEAVIKQVKQAKKYDKKLPILIGTMIEIPRAALTAGDVAQVADFFSFGTNDLTQMTFGYSRDDINTFLPDYLHHEILVADPFQSIDVTGVGQLDTDGSRTGPGDQEELEMWHLRRARWRPRFHPLLP